jgi:hypothetical protein
MWAFDSPQHVGAFDEEDTLQNKWIARARELVQEFPGLYLSEFDFDKLFSVLTENGELDLLNNSVERVNRLNGQEPDFDFGGQAININGERRNMNEIFANRREDGDIIDTLEEIRDRFKKLNKFSLDYWLSRARELTKEFPQLIHLEGIDIDDLLDDEENIDEITDSIDRIEDQEPAADFDDQLININGEEVNLDEYFVGLNASFDADILQTLIDILRNRRIKQKRGGRKPKRSYKKTKPKSKTKKVNKKSHKKTNKRKISKRKSHKLRK